MSIYLRPETVDDALAALAQAPLTIIAGGTDFYPARVGRPLDDDVLDITRLGELRGIEEDSRSFRIGALTTWTDVTETPLPVWFDGLKAAAREIGGAQIQNVATVAGNLCNASPAADGVPVLMSLDASIELASTRGRRSVPVTEFITGNRQTGRAQDEMVTAICVPKPGRPARAEFLKLGARRYLVISIAMVAAAVEMSPGGRVAAARIAVGSCSAVAQRLGALENDLLGKAVCTTLGETARADHLAGLTPIDDVRGTGAYRRDAALALVRRALNRLGKPA
jgi:CO/xanthine dehydrogenase FAD-binding subunit